MDASATATAHWLLSGVSTSAAAAAAAADDDDEDDDDASVDVMRRHKLTVMRSTLSYMKYQDDSTAVATVPYPHYHLPH